MQENIQKSIKNLRKSINKECLMCYSILAETQELLKGTVVARGYSMQDVAEWLDINLSTLYRKISRNGDFSRAEIKILTKRLNLDEQERDSIFFGI